MVRNCLGQNGITVNSAKKNPTGTEFERALHIFMTSSIFEISIKTSMYYGSGDNGRKMSIIRNDFICKSKGHNSTKKNLTCVFS